MWVQYLVPKKKGKVTRGSEGPSPTFPLESVFANSGITQAAHSMGPLLAHGCFPATGFCSGVSITSLSYSNYDSRITHLCAPHPNQNVNPLRARPLLLHPSICGGQKSAWLKCWCPVLDWRNVAHYQGPLLQTQHDCVGQETPVRPVLPRAMRSYLVAGPSGNALKCQICTNLEDSVPKCM